MEVVKNRTIHPHHRRNFYCAIAAPQHWAKLCEHNIFPLPSMSVPRCEKKTTSDFTLCVFFSTGAKARIRLKSHWYNVNLMALNEIFSRCLIYSLEWIWQMRLNIENRTLNLLRRFACFDVEVSKTANLPRPCVILQNWLPDFGGNILRAYILMKWDSIHNKPNGVQRKKFRALRSFSKSLFKLIQSL